MSRMSGANAPPTKSFGPQYFAHELLPPVFDDGVCAVIFDIDVDFAFEPDEDFGDAFSCSIFFSFGIEREKDDDNDATKTKTSSSTDVYASAPSNIAF
jgi:hypothetical protein